MARYLYLILLFLSVTTCQDPLAALSHGDRERITEEVTTMFDNYHESIKKEGLLGEFPFLDHSSDFFWVPPGFTSCIDIDSVKSILSANSNMLNSVHFHWEKLEVFPISTTIANFSGIVGGQMVDTSGYISDVSIIESGTTIKRKDGWKLLNGQSAVLK